VELKQIKELIAVMEKAGIKKMSIKEKTGFELHLEKQDDASQNPPQHQVAYPSFYAPPPHFRENESHSKPGASQKETQEEPRAKKADGKFVLSPMVGTFYKAASPDDPAFVKVGDRVEENTILCIIEAMKVMNEVKAGISGVVAEILADNAHPVEFGTKLFRIE
jgi:acetyl-CoA carboxylase biotin carboxyl carrier protein